eukprot:188972-Prorocentrum_minimum.AAC.1
MCELEGAAGDTKGSEYPSIRRREGEMCELKGAAGDPNGFAYPSIRWKEPVRYWVSIGGDDDDD